MQKSFHFIPSDKEHFILKALELKADAYIFDLEDAVSNSNKLLARQNIVKYVDSFTCKYVRINSIGSEYFDEDVRLIKSIRRKLDGLVIPKIKSPIELEHIFQLIGGNISIIPLFEDFKSLDQASSIFSSSKIQYAALGIEDMFSVIPFLNNNLVDLENTVKLKFVISCYAHGIYPIDIISTERTDLTAFRNECEKGRKSGFIGKLSIHPSQIKFINEVFKSSVNELNWATNILEHESDINSGYKIHADGVLTTPPKIIKARNILNNE